VVGSKALKAPIEMDSKGVDGEENGRACLFPYRTKGLRSVVSFGRKRVLVHFDLERIQLVINVLFLTICHVFVNKMDQ